MDVKKINFNQKYLEFSETWSPRVIAEMNNYQFKLVKIIDDFIWHSHDDTDETFIVIDGEMIIEFRDKEIKLQKGEMCVVPMGVEHRPRAASECKILVIEPKGVVNTGEVKSELTSENDLWI
tara:strand:+ start:528 stop:893 length:366 start_codon:yes stop_codon:yes gene_type:complete